METAIPYSITREEFCDILKDLDMIDDITIPFDLHREVLNGEALDFRYMCIDEEIIIFSLDILFPDYLNNVYPEEAKAINNYWDNHDLDGCHEFKLVKWYKAYHIGRSIETVGFYCKEELIVFLKELKNAINKIKERK